MEQAKVYDMVILGGGPAGLAAAIYAARSLMSVLVIERMLSGGQIASTERVDNYPGFPDGIDGAELSRLLEEQALKFGAELISSTVEKAQLKGDVKKVFTSDGVFHGRTVVIATGTKPRKLGVPGEAELKGRGVSYCVTCDAAFFQDKKVLVVGGGDSALDESLALAKYAKEVTIVHRGDALGAIGILQDRVRENPRIEINLNTIVKRINGKNFVESVTLESSGGGEERELAVDGVFLYVGLIPNTDFINGDLNCTETGHLITDDEMKTSVPGVFGAGDVREKGLRQLVTAVADGAIAAISAARYLDKT